MAEFDKDSIGGGSNHEDETVKRLPSKNSNKATGYLTLNARQAFSQLRQVFTRAPILRHSDPECHIRIEIDASGYTMDIVLSQLMNLGQWHLVAYYS